MTDEFFLVTHYIDDIPSKDGWKKLMFFHRRDDKYYQYMSTKEVDLKRMQLVNPHSGLIALQENLVLKKSQCIWLSEKGEIYVADKLNPFGNKMVILTEPSKKLNYIHPKIHLEALFQKVGDYAETLKQVKDSFEWEKILSLLAECILFINKTQLEENFWIYDVLCHYEMRYQKLFYLFCQKISIWFVKETATLNIENRIFNLPSEISKEDFIKNLMFSKN